MELIINRIPAKTAGRFVLSHAVHDCIHNVCIYIGDAESCMGFLTGCKAYSVISL